VLYEHRRLTPHQGDGLNDHHRGDKLEESPVKKDSTKDLLLMMTDRVPVKFKGSDGKSTTEVGRWCNTCK
jgi:hypothetical protein